MDKLTAGLQEAAREAGMQVQAALSGVKASLAHNVEKRLLTKQKLEELRAKYKQKKQAMKKLMHNFKKRIEADKKEWQEQVQLLHKSLEVIVS